ncbi:MAG: hypothetical protein ACOYLQ_17825 [Hyphomicrobiaceae bacterium]|jgi:hypothetical protein
MRIVRLIPAILALCLIAVVPTASSAAEPAVVTLIGKVGTTNRGPFDPFRDAFLKFRDKKFDKAFAFTHEMLAKLPQVSVTARAEGWPAAVKATGPRLADVLKAAGVAADAKIAAGALDGYTIEFTPADRQAHDWIVAIDADGQPLAIGGRGPTWLIRDTAGAAVKPEVEAPWVWSLYIIEVL